MSGDPESDKLESMAARIRKAEGESGPSKGARDGSAGDLAKASRVGFDFVATFGMCVLVGWLADKWFGSSPWCILGGVLIGFAAGIRNVWRGLAGKDNVVVIHRKSED
jgi:ATP synthase protein I